MQQEKTIQVNLTDKDKIICECGSDKFRQAVRLYRIPQVVIGRKGHVHVMPVFECVDCGLEFTDK